MDSRSTRHTSLPGRAARSAARRQTRGAAVLLTALLALVSLAGCSLSASFAVDRDGLRGPFELGEGGAEAEAIPDELSYEPSPDRAAESGVALDEAPAPAGSGSAVAVADGLPPEEPDSSPAERLRVSTGSLELSVARVEEARRTIIDYAASVGGYVERSSAESLVIRVPAQRFGEAMTRVEREGEVRSRVVETADVTEQYADLERRLEIATASRERLYELLERAEASADEGADERVAILREIRRLTEEIERLRGSIETLAELVAYSRIAVRLVPRIGPTQAMQVSIPFPWIARLDPLQPSVPEADRPIELSLPEAFAVLEEGRRVRAESADGSRIRVGALANEPAGDAAFWSDALVFHLADYYRSAEPLEAGRYRGVVFESRDRTPYSYLVAVAPRGDELVVAEAFFASGEAREEHLLSVTRALEGGAR